MTDKHVTPEQKAELLAMFQDSEMTKKEALLELEISEHQWKALYSDKEFREAYSALRYNSGRNAEFIPHAWMTKREIVKRRTNSAIEASRLADLYGKHPMSAWMGKPAYYHGGFYAGGVPVSNEEIARRSYEKSLRDDLATGDW